MYLSFDPGKLTGWAKFDDNGEGLEYGQLTIDGLIEYVSVWTEQHKTVPIRVIIVEDFVLFRHKAQQQTGSRMEASQAIGILRKFASDVGAKLVMQDPSIKKVAQKWTQLSPKGLSHDKTHWIDAFNHGAFYLINEGIRQTELVRSSRRSND